MATRAEVAGRYRYPYEPQPKQALAHRTWAKERLYGGAAGGGKTDWLLAEVLRPILRYGVDGLLFRRHYPDLDVPQGIISRLLERIPRAVGTYNRGKHRWTFHNGAVLQLAHLAHDGDIENYVGGEVGVIGWDQVEQFTEWQYRRMFHPLRVPEDHPAALAGFVPYMVATANPGGPGHQWVKERWIDPAPPYTVWQPAPTQDERQPGTRAFIPAFLDDNKYLGATYEDNLANLGADTYRALRFGDWDVYSGTRFGGLFRRSTHVIEPEAFPVPEGAGVLKAAAVDYGLEAPFCALWGALFHDGLIVVYRELYESGLTPSLQAQAMRAVEAPAGERSPGRPMPTALDPACWARNPNEPVEPKSGKGRIVISGDAHRPPRGSIAWTYVQNGVGVTKANNDRYAGTARIAEKLRVRADGMPRLLIYNVCTNLIRTLPSTPRDKTNPELYAGSGKAEQHALDTLRYLVMLLDPGDAPNPPPPSSAGVASSAGLRSEAAGLREAGF
jgi:hypothetical protein